MNDEGAGYAGPLGLLLAAIDEAFDGSAWHGPNLWNSVRRVGAAEAAWRPASSRHSIQEVAVHCAYWKYIVRRRLTGDRRLRFPERGSDWFQRPQKPDESRWREDLELLAAQHASLRGMVAALSPESLEAGDAALRRARLLRGIAAHDVYHAGQIRLLRRLYADRG
jgi:uncharacterized damage-inducible protein DinB